jgi:hypothetical protein
VDPKTARNAAPEQSRTQGRSKREARRQRQEESLWSPAERFVLREVLEERDRLREQLDSVRELSDRLIDTIDRKDTRIAELEAAIQVKDRLIADLETENDLLIHGISSREDRISSLEKFLEMIAEADKRA